MSAIMSGVRVLEVAQFTFVPAAGAILADWGADVIKVEHPIRGDTQRGACGHPAMLRGVIGQGSGESTEDVHRAEATQHALAHSLVRDGKPAIGLN